MDKKGISKEILVVDDTPENLRLLTRFLRSSGYSVRPATNGERALDSVKAKLPDLILLDVKMPGMDGYEVCRRLKLNEHSRKIPVIFISAYDQASEVVQSFKEGGVDYITKPFEHEEVLARVNTHLHIAELTEHLEQKNYKLQNEIKERKRVEEALEKARDELEQRVTERTSELADSNAALKNEIDEREQAEEKIRISLHEKSVLLKELYHRTKNNMHLINSMLWLQSFQIDDENTEKIFQVTRDRIQAMALVHEKLYTSINLSHIDLSEYLLELIQLLFESYTVNKEMVSLESEMDRISVSIDTAIPCGLIVNEVITNSLKHAFPDFTNSTIRLNLKRIENGDILLQISDNGIGIPKEFDFRKAESFGLQLIFTLGEKQLGGNVDFQNKNGIICSVTLPSILFKQKM